MKRKSSFILSILLIAFNGICQHTVTPITVYNRVINNLNPPKVITTYTQAVGSYTFTSPSGSISTATCINSESISLSSSLTSTLSTTITIVGTSTTSISNTLTPKNFKSITTFSNGVNSYSNAVNNTIPNSDTLNLVSTPDVFHFDSLSYKLTRHLRNIRDTSKSGRGVEIIKSLVIDSTELNNCVMGKQSFKVGNVSVFQNFASLQDDNPLNATQFNFNYTLPMNRIGGKLVKNVRYPYTFIWLRNLFFTTAITPFQKNNASFSVRDTFLNSEFPDSVLLKSKRPYVNQLDLIQYSRFNINMSVNILTFLTRYYSVYGNLHGGVNRTFVNSSRDSSYSVNFLQYGLNVTLKTKFSIPLNVVLNYRLYSVVPNTSYVNTSLNSQLDKIRFSANGTVLNTSNLELQRYNSVNVTLQYSYGKKNEVKDASPSSRTSSSTSCLYAMFSYNSNQIIGPRNGLKYNNFIMLQVGYSRDIASFIEGIKKILELDK